MPFLSCADPSMASMVRLPPPSFGCRVGTVVFDKTGTVTAGKPQVVDVHVLHEGLSVVDIVQLAAAVEQHSEHPIAAAILNLQRVQQQQYEQQPDGKVDKERGSSSCAPPILQAHGVEVTVGEGISGQVQLPPAQAAAEGSISISSAALLEIQAVTCGGAGAAVEGPATGPAADSKLSGLLSTAASTVAPPPAGPAEAGSAAPAPAGTSDVLVTVGNKRRMAEAGVLVPGAAERYMHGQEVRLTGGACVAGVRT